MKRERLIVTVALSKTFAAHHPHLIGLFAVLLTNSLLDTVSAVFSHHWRKIAPPFWTAVLLKKRLSVTVTCDLNDPKIAPPLTVISSGCLTVFGVPVALLPEKTTFVTTNLPSRPI
jgi:hypothetical protein